MAERILLLVETNAQSRDALSASLTDQHTTIVHCDTFEQVLTASSTDTPKCLVVAVQNRILPGIELIEKLTEAKSSLPVIALLDRPNTPLTVQLVQLGVLNVLDKPVDEEALRNSIEEAWSYSSLKTSGAVPKLDVERRIGLLTPGQRQVLYMVVAGTANKVIASRLGVSVRTIENWRRRVFQVLEVKSVADLVRTVMNLPNPELAADAH